MWSNRTDSVRESGFAPVFQMLFRCFGFIFFLFLLAVTPAAGSDRAGAGGEGRSGGGQTGKTTFWSDFQPEWGGHVKLQAQASWPGRDTYWDTVGLGPYYDVTTDFRLKNKLFFGRWGSLETHYEAVYSVGDTRRKQSELAGRFPALAEVMAAGAGRPDDDHRFFDLTRVMDETGDRLLYHRLDRLVLTVQPSWGTIRLGRQAATWGNGLLFNPMDLFNPFSPADFVRDYKVGDDMVSVQFPVATTGDAQFLYVPRRDRTTRDVEWNQSSCAGKVHFASGDTEFDLMAGHHYQDSVVGFGSTGYWGNAAWRLDATWTFLEEDRGKDGYLSLVANMDYSWVWAEKNYYGFIEFFYNGLGTNRYQESLTDLDLAERLSRGELYSLGRYYLSGHVKVELHPLFSIYLTLINNLSDPSGTFQPRAVWDVSQNVQVTFGANVHYGSPGTEYGGWEIPGTRLLSGPSNAAYVWVSYYF
ncbi:MAG: hypothetical protein KKB20_28870 [Proteobacteria bacterium]|nr:hypothetical protein [Pseudomonadota bacterium]